MAELPTVGATDGLGNLSIDGTSVVEVLNDNNKPVGEDEEGFIITILIIIKHQ